MYYQLLILSECIPARFVPLSVPDVSWVTTFPFIYGAHSWPKFIGRRNHLRSLLIQNLIVLLETCLYHWLIKTINQKSIHWQHACSEHDLTWSACALVMQGNTSGHFPRCANVEPSIYISFNDDVIILLSITAWFPVAYHIMDLWRSFLSGLSFDSFSLYWLYCLGRTWSNSQCSLTCSIKDQ